MGWRNRPTFKSYWDPESDYFMFIDESGNSNPKYIINCIKNGIDNIDVNNRYLTITGVVIHRDDFLTTKNNILSLKTKHWPENGIYPYFIKKLKSTKNKRICLHSTEIRRKKPPFDEHTIRRDDFLEDLNCFMSSSKMIIFSSTIDLYKHYMKYKSNAVHPYSQCLNFILERFVKYYLKSTQTASILLESRGKNEDSYILTHLKELIDGGTTYANKDYFKKIKGVYFNPKWCKESEEMKSYFGLEIADLCCSTISKYTASKVQEKSFDLIEDKIYGYPRTIGYGIKKFP